MELVLKRWDGSDPSYPTKPGENYVGEDYSEYYHGPIKYPGQSNFDEQVFDKLLEKLGGESDTVLVARFRHWATGYMDMLLIHESDEESLEKVNDVAILMHERDYEAVAELLNIEEREEDENE